MLRFDVTAKLLLGLALGLALGACQAIAGIEDRQKDPSKPAVDRVDSSECKTYCATVTTNCTEPPVYAGIEQCLALCAKLDIGPTIEPEGTNTVNCRIKQAGGDGPCDSDCKAYCDLFSQICPDNDAYAKAAGSPQKGQAACLKACSGLKDQHTFDPEGADHGGNTVECRLTHVANAVLDPTTHCPHAVIVNPVQWCVDPPKEAPNCDDYCKIELTACDDASTKQYENLQQCLDVCSALTPGTNADTLENTVGCRLYHAFNATLGAEAHCPHSGPTGEGHCGSVTSTPADGFTSNCESYCQIVKLACREEFDSELVDADGCMAACIELDGATHDSGYTLEIAKKSKGLPCRVLHATRAFADATECAAAVGLETCN
jgi:hypothetical protein